VTPTHRPSRAHLGRRPEIIWPAPHSTRRTNMPDRTSPDPDRHQARLDELARTQAASARRRKRRRVRRSPRIRSRHRHRDGAGAARHRDVQGSAARGVDAAFRLARRSSRTPPTSDSAAKPIRFSKTSSTNRAGMGDSRWRSRIKPTASTLRARAPAPPTMPTGPPSRRHQIEALPATSASSPSRRPRSTPRPTGRLPPPEIFSARATASLLAR